MAAMIVTAFIATMIVAAGTLFAGAVAVVKLIYRYALKQQEEKVYRAKIAADIEDLQQRSRQGGEGRNRSAEPDEHEL